MPASGEKILFYFIDLRDSRVCSPLSGFAMAALWIREYQAGE